MEQTLITKEKVAELAGVTTRTVCRWRARGYLTQRGTLERTGAALFDAEEAARVVHWHQSRTAPFDPLIPDQRGGSDA